MWVDMLLNACLSKVLCLANERSLDFQPESLRRNLSNRGVKWVPSGSANDEGSSKIIGVERFVLDMCNGHDLSFGSHTTVPNEEFTLFQID